MQEGECTVVNILGDLGVLLRGLPIGGGEFESVMTRNVVNLLNAGKGVMWYLSLCAISGSVSFRRVISRCYMR